MYCNIIIRNSIFSRYSINVEPIKFIKLTITCSSLDASLLVIFVLLLIILDRGYLHEHLILVYIRATFYSLFWSNSWSVESSYFLCKNRIYFPFEIFWKCSLRNDFCGGIFSTFAFHLNIEYISYMCVNIYEESQTKLDCYRHQTVERVQRWEVDSIWK